MSNPDQTTDDKGTGDHDKGTGLGARFGVTAESPTPAASLENETTADPFERDQPVPPPPRRRSLIPVAFWLPESLIARLSAYCDHTRTTRREALLQAVEATVETLPDLIRADAHRRAEQAVPHDDVGGLFPRNSGASRPGRTVAEPSATITVRVRADHLSTMDRIAGNHDLSRSALARVALTNYLPGHESKT